jgi:hypothetical protein
MVRDMVSAGMFRNRDVFLVHTASSTDPLSGRTVWTEEPAATDQPCRLSFGAISETDLESGAAKVT